MLVKVTPPELTEELVASLVRSDCLVHRVSSDTCSVFHLYARDRREARVELRLFLEAWTMRHPQARVALMSEELVR
jgi:hypothetical protein